MKDLMMLCGVTMGQRYTQKQKQTFFDEVNRIFTSADKKVTLQSVQDRYSAVNNIIIGDLNQAKTIIAAAYDTPSKVYLPHYIYYPFDTKKNLKNENLNLMFQFAVSCLAFGLIYYLLRGFLEYEMIYKVLSVISSLIIFGTAYFFVIKVNANRVNFSRNSAAVTALLTIASKIQRKDVAFVLLDQSVLSYRGLTLLKENLSTKPKFLLLENMASGNVVVAAAKETTGTDWFAKQTEIEIRQRLFSDEMAANSALALIDNMIMLVCGDIENNRFIIKNTRTRKDIDIDMPRLEKMTGLIIDYLNR